MEPSSWQDLMDEADKVAVLKGRDYTKGGDGDRLANFRTSAKEAGITPIQAWLVFFNKHHAAICSYVKSGGQNESEPIFGRFVDALNYIRLGWLIVREMEEAKTKSQLDLLTVGCQMCGRVVPVEPQHDCPAKNAE